MSRRTAGWALIVYGLLGLALIVGGAVIGLDAAGRVERLAGAAGGTLEAAARSTRAAADSFVSVDGSLSEAERSADGAAALAREASATLDGLAVAMQLSVFGAQPLQPLAEDFSTSADQAVELADMLDSVVSSLSDTRTDVAVIGTELSALSRELDGLQETSAEGGVPRPPLRLFVGLLLAWLAMPAVGALLYGFTLLRTPRTVAPPAGP